VNSLSKKWCIVAAVSRSEADGMRRYSAFLTMRSSRRLHALSSHNLLAPGRLSSPASSPSAVSSTIDDVNQVALGKQPCKLCIRPFGWLRRKVLSFLVVAAAYDQEYMHAQQQCGLCEDVVCTACCAQRALLEDSPNGAYSII